MSQNPVVVSNGAGSAVRAAINNALNSLVTINSGPSAPATTYANMLWYDTTNNIMMMRNSANTAWRGLLPPGIGPLPFAGTVAPNGYLLFGSDYSRTTYADLFAVVGTKFGSGDGSTTFGLHFEGRGIISVGTGTMVATGLNADVDTVGNTLAVALNNTTWITGMPVVFTLTSGTITGLTSGVTYYVIRSSSTLIQLASTLANAQNNVPIALTAKSSPVWTITYNMTTRTLGEKGGEESHAQNILELVSHSHPENIIQANAGGATGNWWAGNNVGNAYNNQTGVAGGNQAANIMQPFMAMNHIITF